MYQRFRQPNQAIERRRFPCLFNAKFAISLLFAAALLSPCGCAHPQVPRLQAEDENEQKEFPGVDTIGDVTSVANAEPVPVSAVGIVVGLEGTGGSAPTGSLRTMLESQLKEKGVEHIKEILASRDTSMVLVSAQIPPGAHKGDPLDIVVTLPEGSHTTSLKGGYLKECFLYNYDSTKNLAPNYDGPDRIKLGHRIAWAEGPLLVGFGDGEESAKVREGRIWGGGHSKIDRPFILILNEGKQQGPVAQHVADRVNETLQGPYHGSLTDLAAPKTGTVVYLRVPQQYKLNLPRYLRVVRLIPLEGTPAGNSPYRRRLAEQVLDPAHTVTAALRLEALGRDSVPALKKGLESEHVLVRFCVAEALAYLGDPAGGDQLATLTEQQPALRAFCLTALASLDEAICHVKLRELMSSNSAETRYGAFRALRALDEQEPSVQGEQLNDSFWLHRAVPNATPLVHLSSSRRAEMVIFGEEPCLMPPFSFLTGEFTVTAATGDDRCTLSRFSVQHGTCRHQCSLRLEDVVRNLAEMGGQYPDIFELMRHVNSCRCLSCPVVWDALPQATTIYELARTGAGDNPELLQVDQEIRDARDEMGATPTLYDRGDRRRVPAAPVLDDEVESQDKKPASGKPKPAA